MEELNLMTKQDIDAISLEQSINNWNNDVEFILERIRQNSIILSHRHKKYYNFLKEKLKYFKIPIIILSAINTVLSVSLNSYTIYSTLIVCGINLIMTIVSSIELFLQIQKQMENNYILQRDFYILGIDIYKTLKLGRNIRNTNGTEYLEKSINEYSRLFQLSSLQNIKDGLAPIDEEHKGDESPNSSVVKFEVGV